MSDLVDRLRKVDAWDYDRAGNVTATYYHNPDGPGAADEITRLTAEVERLNEQLENARAAKTLHVNRLTKEVERMRPVVDAARELHRNIPSNAAIVGQWQLELAFRALDGEP